MANVGIVGSYVCKSTYLSINQCLFLYFIVDIIDTLAASLEQLSRSYGKRTLGAIFLMNNYQYIYKMIESSFQDWLGPSEAQKYEQLVKQQREVYQAR
jgi:hypothetical protein